MMIDTELVGKINSERASDIFSKLYGQHETEAARKRYVSLINEMTDNSFPAKELKNADGDLRIFSSPGRTELAGNHTDHNRGKVLAASIQPDSVAVVQKRSDNVIFFRSKGFPDVKVKLTDASGVPDLKPKPEEAGTTESLIRGIAAEINRRFSASKKVNSAGLCIGGFSANAESTVLPGSGLSSSAAVEVLIGRILDSLYSNGLNGETSGEKLSTLEIAQICQYAENVYFGKPCGLMDQTACATGGAVAIDFENTDRPIVKQINFDLSAVGYAICVVNTGGSHADLTADYASIPAEMKSVAAFFGKSIESDIKTPPTSVLREIDKETVLSHAAEIRKALGDRSLLRAIHFFDENDRVDAMTVALLEMEKSNSHEEKKAAFYRYLRLVDESGDSSWKLLQNIYSPNSPIHQGVTTALALTKEFLRKQNFSGACRVHGGGFAGTIQSYIPLNAIDDYRTCMETVFGASSVTPLRIRPIGAVELFF